MVAATMALVNMSHDHKHHKRHPGQHIALNQDPKIHVVNLLLPYWHTIWNHDPNSQLIMLVHNVYAHLLELQGLNQVNELTFVSVVEATMMLKSTQGLF